MSAPVAVRAARPDSVRSPDTSPWRCPRCHGSLVAPSDQVLQCDACGVVYEVVAGIPDLRVDGAVWIDRAQDRDSARRLDAETANLPIEDIVRRVYSEREGWDRALVEWRTRQVIEAPTRLRSEIGGWLAPATSRRGFVDLGCGPGQLLAAAAAAGGTGIGIDVSLVWLVVAKRLIEHYGGRPVLAAALAEALPLADASVPAVVSLDVIEHVGDQPAYLREIDRVTAHGGTVALATPNRFSLAAEPHVFVWGVGWLPRAFQSRYVAWRSGKSYEFTRLLGVRETQHLLRQHTRLVPAFLVPPVPREEIARMGRRRATLARVYNRLAATRWLRPAFLAVGPFFRVLAHKAESALPGAAR